jgi:ankyrin repeat protein
MLTTEEQVIQAQLIADYPVLATYFQRCKEQNILFSVTALASSIQNCYAVQQDLESNNFNGGNALGAGFFVWKVTNIELVTLYLVLYDQPSSSKDLYQDVIQSTQPYTFFTAHYDFSLLEALLARNVGLGKNTSKKFPNLIEFLLLHQRYATIISLLERKVIDPAQREDHIVTGPGRNMLHMAIEHPVILEYIVKHYPELITSLHEGKTALTIAELKDYNAAIKLLLPANAAVPGFKISHTLLHTAVQEKDLALVQTILQLAPELVKARDRDRYERTPLHIAALKGKTDIFLELRKHQANFYALDDLGLTPLHYVASQGCTDLIELFKNKQPGFGIVGRAGITAFHYAVLFNQLEFVKQLLPHMTLDVINAPVKEKFELIRKPVLLPGDTALTIARKLGNKDMHELLQAYGAKENMMSTEQAMPQLARLGR